MLFRPTRRTQILMAGVVVAGLVGAYVMWRDSERRRALAAQAQARVEATTTPEAGSPAARLITQLNQRFGAEPEIFYASSQASGVVCAYAAPRRSNASSGPARVSAFVSAPDRLVGADDDPNFERLLLSSCPNFPGARRPGATPETIPQPVG